MNRRTFLCGLTLGTLAAPLADEAQQVRAVRVGWLLPDPKPFALDPFRQALKELGWSEGDNLIIEERYSQSSADRYLQLAAELVRLKVNALVTDGTPATKAAQQTTSTIPIVFVTGDPVARGFVETLAHPGRNLTGVAIITGDLTPKRIQLLKELAPRMTRLTILEDSTAGRLTSSEAQLPAVRPAIEAALRHLGIQLTPPVKVRTREELAGAFAVAVRERADGVLVVASSFFSAQSRQIASLAATSRLPAIYCSSTARPRQPSV
jgi:putative tryptophan/tyrosine transport system substrate-binding protein